MPALLADGYGVRCEMLEMLELDICLCHGVDAPQRTRVNGSRNGCRLRVAGCASCKCCLYYLLATKLSILRPCSANALLARTNCVCCLGYGRVTSYPRFPRRVATLSSITLTLSTTTTCTILMQITATVQGSALSNESKLQLDSSVGTYLN
jgi:hypothetical protein